MTHSMNPTCGLPNPDSRFRGRRAGCPEAVELEPVEPEPAVRWQAHLRSAHRELTHPESPLQRMIGGIVRWHRRRAAIRALRSLNDHSLADIGLERVRTVPALEEMIRETPRRAGGAIAEGRTQHGGRQG
ncbi:DUF1127 domain-containing protein [Denitrobaculum tricleocarpae]|uniref:DUF1127 domain-containing protein n=1 Tax=Denitrobaculum tricleocarpae TaxID=2591009 RepID=A0A545T5M3_9PROT|nr:DUF1127 domain-containing protein [Denitrobaculum tricleocarpae]TQV72468.1 DUF1127 domain-containing protein [Denitrobaculum tricleocarpae]